MVEVRVTKPYSAQYADPIAFEAGEPIDVQKEDAEFPGWHWCRNRSGKEGWVHYTYLASRHGATVGVGNYTARELSVSPGDKGTLLQRLDGWLYVRLENGDDGWLPQSHATVT